MQTHNGVQREKFVLHDRSAAFARDAIVLSLMTSRDVELVELVRATGSMVGAIGAASWEWIGLPNLAELQALSASPIATRRISRNRRDDRIAIVFASADRDTHRDGR